MAYLGFGLAGLEALPPEIGFLVGHGVEVARLARAAGIAKAAGTDAATALLRTGLMTEDAYYRALAGTLGTPFLADAIPLGPGTRYPESLVAGIAPLAPGAEAAFVLAPRGSAVVELLAGRSPSGRLPAITTPSALRRAVFAAFPAGIAACAADTLHRERPDWAYHPGPQPPQVALALIVAGAVLAFVLLLPAFVVAGAWLLVQFGVLAMVAFRIAAAGVEGAAATHPPVADVDLPVYTVLVALYRETEVVPRLVSALSRLDYPAAKLDIKIVIEAEDSETASALAKAELTPVFEVVVAPPGDPRTKPRALNVALPLARGGCLVVYDAEDVPDVRQLRAAAETFAASSMRTACLQGRLVIDNTHDSWLTRCFTLEYTALFDVLGPALAAWRVPIPLGGTSTHFRTDVLRAVHGWDAWNVTEDADLGLRLALAGYHVGDLPSSTIEEAPAELRPWLRQRTRWMKGFIQTSFTHGRRPLATMRRLGVLGSLCAVVMLPATVLSALAYPFLMAATLVSLAVRDLPGEPDFWSNVPAGTAVTVFLSGFAAMIAPAIVGCRRRGWRDLIPAVAWLPVYFLLVGLAAWLGLIELFVAPARWNKTTHGLARTSRSGTL